MTFFRESTRNINDTAVQASVTMNSSTTTKIVDLNLNRLYLRIDNVGNQTVHLKLQAASVDNIKIGIQIPPDGFWEMPTDNSYTGEVSGIAASDGPAVNYTEY